jgi:phosphatidylethanolamine/phosphatidyl-N-methylethanolamine N-methyltransferase
LIVSLRKGGHALRLGITQKLVQRFDDEIIFLKGMISSPDTVGSIIPTSRVTARCMADQIDLSSNLPIWELGPGTGVITKAILNRGVEAKDLYCVEYSEEFTRRLKIMLPDVNIVNGDAFDLDNVLGDMRQAQFDTIITSMPLLNFPMMARKRLINDLLNRMPEGRPIVLFSYGATAPVPTEGEDFEVKAIRWVIRNVPPARVWAYTRKSKTSQS